MVAVQEMSSWNWKICDQVLQTSRVVESTCNTIEASVAPKSSFELGVNQGL